MSAQEQTTLPPPIYTAPTGQSMEMTPQRPVDRGMTGEEAREPVILGLRGGRERGFIAGCLGALCICCACDCCLDCLDDCCC